MEPGTYTITEVREGTGSTAGWGRISSGWISISVQGKRINLGVFGDLVDAVAARKAAEEKSFGEYSYDASMAYAAQYALPEGNDPVPEDQSIPEVTTSFLTPMPPQKPDSGQVKILPRYRVLKVKEVAIA